MPTGPQRDLARHAVSVLRSMHGAAGKLAQLADFVDPRWAPEPERPALERELAALRSRAPAPLPFKRVERLLRDAWGGRLGGHVAEFDPEPAARASAGQVHRAVLPDGREVAVKVLHPGIEEALRADLGNLGLLAQLASGVVPGLDPRGLTAEIRERVLEEFDLEHEAQAQRTFARAYRGHPFVMVPAPVTELCHTGVLVADWVEGEAFEAVLARPAAERDRYGEILARFHIGAMVHLGAFHADPHPGNHRLLPDGRVACLDFGAIGHAAPEWLAAVLDLADAAERGDEARVARDLADLGYLTAADDLDAGHMLEHLLAAGGWLLEDRPVRIDAALGRRLAGGLAADPAAVDLARFARVPARDLQAGRMLAGLGAVLARLEARANWGAIAAEQRRRGEPGSELGGLEAGFWDGRGHSRGAAMQTLRRVA